MTVYFVRLKKDRSKQKWDKVADQGNELNLLLAQWESPEDGTGGLLFRKLTGPESLKRMQVVICRKIVDAVLEMMHDSITAGHMGVRTTLNCTRLRFYWYKQRESVVLWCRLCTRYAVRKSGDAKKSRAALRKSVTGKPVAHIGNDISGPYKVSDKYLLVVSDYFTKWVKA